jgi:hypothetical protein
VPTYSYLTRFMAEFSRLEPSQREAFMVIVALLVADLRAGGRPRPRCASSVL